MLSLRNKTYLLLLLITAGFLVISYGLVWRITSEELQALQRHHAEEQVSLVERLLHQEMSNLSARQADWAQWDDTYKFITDRNEEYIESNLNDESLAVIHVDIMVFVNNAGEIVFGKQVYTGAPTERVIPADFLRYFQKGSDLLDFQEGTPVKQGILTVSDTMLLVSAQPITMSDGRSVRRGTLIFGRYLDQGFSETLSSLSGMDVRLTPYDSDASVSHDADTTTLRPEARTVVKLTSDETMGFRLLDNVFGNPSLVLRVAYPSQIIQDGRSFLWNGLWYSFLALITYISLLIVFIDYFLLRRIENMRRIARKVSVLHAGELPEGDVDDFSYLASVMMGAIKNIQNSNEIAVGSRGELEMFKTALDESFDHMIITDPDGKILHANVAAENLTGYTRQEMVGQTPALWGRQMSAKFYKELWDTIRLHKRKFEGEVTNRTKQGIQYRAQIRVAPILDNKRQVLYFVGIERPAGKV